MFNFDRGIVHTLIGQQFKSRHCVCKYLKKIIHSVNFCASCRHSFPSVSCDGSAAYSAAAVLPAAVEAAVWFAPAPARRCILIFILVKKDVEKYLKMFNKNY